MDNSFKDYKRSGVAQMRPVTQKDLDGANEFGDLLGVVESSIIVVSISAQDILKGSPKIGDMIARNPNDHLDQWLVSEEYFNENFIK